MKSMQELESLLLSNGRPRMRETLAAVAEDPREGITGKSWGIYELPLVRHEFCAPLL